MENPCTVACFGDSLTQEYSPVFENEFRNRLPEIEIQFIHAGIRGETSADALKRVDRLLSQNPDVMVMGFGTNDLNLRAPDEFQQNMERLIRKIKKTGCRLILLTIHPLINREPEVIRYNLIIEDLAHKYFLRVAAVYDRWKRELGDHGTGFSDTVHLNLIGKKKYSSTVLRTIRRKRMIILWQYNGNPAECNYTCPYCTYDPRKQAGHHFTGSIEEWKQAFLDSFGDWPLTFYLGHGEPTVGERFYDVVDMVESEPNWELRLVTNLSTPLERMVSRPIAEEGRLHINPSFHPHMIKPGKFIEKILYLRENGIEVPVIIVMWPPIIKKFSGYFELFDAKQFLVHVRRFRGKYRGLTYPQAYTEEERKFIARYCDDGTIKYMLNESSETGWETYSGMYFVLVDNEGNVGYCDDLRPSKEKDRWGLGNVLRRTVRLFKEPMPFPGAIPDGTVDGVANFLKLEYRELEGNHIFAFARQGGVYRTAAGVHYKNRYKDFGDPKIRREYKFPESPAGQVDSN